MSLNSDFQKLFVDGLITLFEIDASKLGAGILRFHGHISFQDWEKICAFAGSDSLIGSDTDLIGKVFESGDEKVWQRNIIFNGQTYEPTVVKVEGLKMDSSGKASSPTLTLANNINGIQGAVSAYCYRFKDFAGAKVKVIRTLAKYLDAENFSGGNASASPNEAKTQLWFIEQKTSENVQQVTFELSNPIDFEGLKIPVRNITGYCDEAVRGRYRGETCKYTGMKYFTDKDEPTDDPSLDKCRGGFESCKARNNTENFCGFVSSNMIG